MTMTKQDFVKLADLIRKYPEDFESHTVTRLAGFCKEQNDRFNAYRWFEYIAGRCGPGGGKVKCEPKQAN